jgi:uncharacterized protein YjdB
MKSSIKKSKPMLGLLAGLLVIISAACQKDDINVTALSLDKTNAIVEVGATLSLVHFITPGDATNQNIIWRSAHESIATVEDGTRATS